VFNQNFYRDIKALNLPITEVLREQHFSDVPHDWFVVIADVKNSTGAIAEGRHNDVNLVAAGSLIAALNIAKEKSIEIPFFFSGDGGAVIVPESIVNEVLNALARHNENIQINFGLTMHLGSLCVKDIFAVGAKVKIAKIQLGQSFNKALLVGNGLKYAEQQIKNKSGVPTQNADTTDILNMAGLECRWDKVKPPADENEIVCYLIEAKDQTKQADVYRDALTKIDQIYGSIESRSPLSVSRLKLLLNLKKMEKEMKAKFGGWRIGYYISTFFENLLGIIFFALNLKIGTMRGNDYLAQLVSNADTLTIDGRINTIISGSTEKRKLLLEYLKAQEKAGTLVFGHHMSKESIMTCYIENMNSKHIHFVDGSDGGYTEAAKELKAKAAVAASQTLH